jgi:adenylate cyclase
MGRRLSHQCQQRPGVGRHRFTYDIWSDTVNTASPHGVERHSGTDPRVPEETYRRLFPTYEFECRGQREIKGKGPMTTYFLIGRQSNVLEGAAGR